MGLYTIYVCHADGRAAAVESREAPSDDLAAQQALDLLVDFPDCDYAAIWQGQRPVGIQSRHHNNGGEPDVRSA